MDNWQQTIQDIKDVFYGMWVENKITKTEYQNLFMSMNGGPIGTDATYAAAYADAYAAARIDLVKLAEKAMEIK